MMVSKFLTFCIPYALLAFAILIIQQNFSLGLGFVIVVLSWLWLKRHYMSDFRSVEFFKLHDVPQYTGEVSALVTSEWPVPVTAEGIEEANFVRTSSLRDSCNTLPCHLLALASRNGVKEVVAHGVLRETQSSRPPNLNKFLKMLKAGLSLATVRQAMETAGLDPSVLSDKNPREMESSPIPSLTELRNVTLSALVVKPEFRGLGLGKGMCAYAAQVASGLGAQEVIGSCLEKVRPFYEKMGVRKRSFEQREGMPRVRLGNEMFVTLDHEAEDKAAKILDMLKGN